MFDPSILELSEPLQKRLSQYREDVKAIRSSPLDPASLAKLRAHFRTMHIFHSAGIEGNRLTLQETRVALEEGIDISGKPLRDVVEVRSLAAGFDYLQELVNSPGPLREIDIRRLHELVVGNDVATDRGAYRTVAVVISGAEHRPPEPIEVPQRMQRLIEWVNLYSGSDPILLGALAHHELVAIHPFVDGNGRVSRLLLNLILMRAGYPIANVRKDERPAYYEALAFADVGLPEPLLQLIADRVDELLREYQRLLQENKRAQEWADRWKVTEASVLLRREQREWELWRSRMLQVRLEFEKAADLLNDALKDIAIDFEDSKREIDFDTYQMLRSTGKIDHSHAFYLQLFHKPTKRREKFMFRYYRNWDKFQSQERVIPLA